MSRGPWEGAAPPPVSERPECPQCGKPLQPYVHSVTGRDDRGNGFRLKEVARRWERGWNRQRPGYGGYGYFCSLRCGTAFANRAYFDMNGKRANEYEEPKK